MSNNLVADRWVASARWVGKVVGGLVCASGSADLGAVVLRCGLGVCGAEADELGADVGVIGICWVGWNAQLTLVS